MDGEDNASALGCRVFSEEEAPIWVFRKSQAEKAERNLPRRGNIYIVVAE